MFSVDANYGIRITRGDTASLEVTFEGDAPGAEDTVIASVKKGAKKPDTLLEQELQLVGTGTDGEGAEAVSWSKYLLTIASEDTEKLAFGGYVWDLRILYADGQITTPFPPAAFDVLEVVTELPE